MTGVAANRKNIYCLSYLMVCKQVQETVHHSFNSWFWSAPVIRNLQNGTLQTDKNRKKNISETPDRNSEEHQRFSELTLDPAVCGCHRREDRRADVLREVGVHGDIWTTEREQKCKLDQQLNVADDQW